MLLIADCGSSKIEWALLSPAGDTARFHTPGMNALMLTPAEIQARFAAELMPCLGDPAAVGRVCFYGAGCVSDEVCGNVAAGIRGVLPDVEVEVYTDLLAAARALCGQEAGIACILGTGSNSCLYDGNSIVSNVSPLGYILGDEGSGAVLGRTLVGDVLKRQLPSDICDEFHSRTGLDRLTIINNVYRQPGANKFLASLVPFLSENISRPEIRNLVLGSFVSFFRRNVRSYAGHESIPCGFVGSVAYYFADVLREAAAVSGCKVGTILKAPMDGLIKYHSLNKLSAI